MNRIKVIIFHPVNLEKSCESCPFEALIPVEISPQIALPNPVDKIHQRILARFGTDRRSALSLVEPPQQGFVKNLRRDRLGNKVVHPRLEALLLVLGKGIRRHRQDG